MRVLEIAKMTVGCHTHLGAVVCIVAISSEWPWGNDLMFHLHAFHQRLLDQICARGVLQHACMPCGVCEQPSIAVPHSALPPHHHLHLTIWQPRHLPAVGSVSCRSERWQWHAALLLVATSANDGRETFYYSWDWQHHAAQLDLRSPIKNKLAGRTQ